MGSVVVTVGMGRWPFDRLVTAAGSLSDRHDVFIQTGTSNIRPPCDHEPWLDPVELEQRMLAADVVVTHAGNTVRWLQRRGRVPVAVAREASRAEMGNDHQVRYLRDEEQHGPVLAVWDLDRLADVVDRHAELAAGVVRRTVPQAADPDVLRDRLDALELLDRRVGPFSDHPIRRYDFAWRHLAGRSGRHLDLGCNDGELLDGLLRTTALDAVGVDANSEVVHRAAERRLPVARTDRWGRLPFADATFSSATVLDVLEHVPDEVDVLRELRRVLRPGAVVVLSVPARHAFSCLDPDNIKLRFPGVHGVVYRARFGRQRYRQRFVELEDGFRGDLAVERRDHTNYRPEVFMELLGECGLVPLQRSGANLFWRTWQPVELLARGRARRAAERLTQLDGRRFSSANLFVVAEAT